jgi:hypothetical protein
METGFPVLVIPGHDPGIAPIDGVRGDPRIKSGDDEETTCVGHPLPAFGAQMAGTSPAMTVRTRFQSS